MNDKAFVDTNIVVYAHLKQSTEFDKWETAHDLLDNSRLVMSTQVLGEYYVTLSRHKVADTVIQDNIRLLIQRHEICLITLAVIHKAHQIKLQYGFSYWDSLILATALENQCNRLYSEDMQHGQVIANKLQIINPFL